MGQSFSKWTGLVLLAGWVLWTGGCAGKASNSGPAAPAAPSRPGPATADQRFVIAPELAGALHVVRVMLKKPPGGYLKIQVTVENMTTAPRQFSYRIEWFDAEGARLPVAGQEFIPWRLLSREVASIAVTAPTAAAADFGIAFVPAVH
jgi:uncharacterized protein YcfL